MPETKTEHRSAQGAVLRGREAVRDAFAPLLVRARREVALFAVHPDPFYLDAEHFVDALAAFATRHRHNLARLLVDDPARLFREHIRLAGVMRRVSDGIQVREMAEHDRGRSDLFLLIDRREYLVLDDAAGIDGRVGAARREAIALSETFEAMWERGTPSPPRPLGL